MKLQNHTYATWKLRNFNVSILVNFWTNFIAFCIVNYVAPEEYAHLLFGTCLFQRNCEIADFTSTSRYFIHFMIITLQYQ